MALGALIEATIRSSDVERSERFYTEAFQWSALERDARGVRMGVPGTQSGFVRLERAQEQLSQPARNETEETRPFTLGARLLGVYSQDLARTRTHLEAAGSTMGPVTSYPYGDFMNEAVASGPDEVFFTLPHVSPRRPSVAFDQDAHRLHSELHSAVINVTDLDEALRFFADAGGLKVLFSGPMGGPAFERMIGMPPGASLRIAFLAAADEKPARLELMQFIDLGEATRPFRPSSTGISRLAFECTDVAATRSRLIQAGGREDREGTILGPMDVEIDLKRDAGHR